MIDLENAFSHISEGGNGSMQHQGLKRLPSYGLSRGRKEMAMADLLENLTTLGRLVLEATAAHTATTG